MVDLIKKKRNGKELTREDFQVMIDGMVSGDIPDYQVSAFLMAVYFQGMTALETAIFTDVMMRSGDLIDLSEIAGVKVDKHSTGGVGDKTTLILGPLVAAAGVPVAKMSGRGLGHTGGTLDKLESIKGLSVDMSRSEFIERLKEHNIAICGQNAKLVPADKKLYALRDVTGTIGELSLISSSIMSKKLACGAEAIVIDIKVGSGAFMKTVESAEKLAELMIDIGSKMGRRIIAVVSAMQQPLGLTVGNALEVEEAIQTLKGKGPEDLTELCLVLGSNMLVLGGIVADAAEGRKKLQAMIDSGEALDKFKELVQAQGGDVSVIDDENKLPKSKYSRIFNSPFTGYVNELYAMDVGLASVKLGAGRETKASVIDFGAGIRILKKVGDRVEKGEPLAILYAGDESLFEPALEKLNKAYVIGDTKPEDTPLVYKILE